MTMTNCSPNVHSRLTLSANGARAAIVGLAMVCLLTLGTTLVQAATAVVETTAGRQIEGELVSRDQDKVVLTVSGIKTPIARDHIKSVTMKKSPKEIYKARKAKLKEEDLDGRFNLAYDLYQMQALDLAMKEVTALKKDFPDAQRVDALQGTLKEAKSLQNKQRKATGGNRAANANPNRDDRGGNSANGRSGQGSANNPSFNSLSTAELRKMQLTDKQINLLKIWELPSDLEKAKVRIRVPRKVIEKVLSQYSESQDVPKGRSARDELRQAEGWEQLGLLFDLHARQFYPKVRVIGAPPALLEYRQRVGPQYVNSYFFRNFGQGQIKGLRLFGNQGAQPQSAYTDFYILSKYKTKLADMIDRQEPGKSLLLQWGLPRNQAAFPAPKISGWRPYFSGPQDPRYRRTLDWIDRLYNNPEYGIDYDSPENKDGIVPDSDQSASDAAAQQPETEGPDRGNGNHDAGGQGPDQPNAPQPNAATPGNANPGGGAN